MTLMGEMHVVPGRPDVAIIVTREPDDYYSWDGDGPDPRDEGLEPCNVIVTAYAVRDGRLYTGEATLGGSYYLPDEATDDAHGYLPQMIDEAIEGLEKAVGRL